MKKLLLFSGAVIGAYLLAKRLNNSFVGNDVTAAGIGTGSGNFNGGNTSNDLNDDYGINADSEKVVLADGGNEFGDTGGHSVNS